MNLFDEIGKAKVIIHVRGLKDRLLLRLYVGMGQWLDIYLLQ